jgi:hypothetical protein
VQPIGYEVKRLSSTSRERGDVYGHLPEWAKSELNSDGTPRWQVTELYSAEQISELSNALQRIEKWFGEFPSTGQFWDKDQTQPISYAAQYGSNGERDFIREIARVALVNAGIDLRPQESPDAN